MSAVIEAARDAGFSEDQFSHEFIEGADAAVCSAVMSRCNFGDVRRYKERQAVRRQRAVIRKEVCGSLGVTLLTLLFNFALNKLINWLIDRWFNAVTHMTMVDWCDQPLRAMFAQIPQSNNAGLLWCVFDYVF